MLEIIDMIATPMMVMGYIFTGLLLALGIGLFIEYRQDKFEKKIKKIIEEHDRPNRRIDGQTYTYYEWIDKYARL